MKTKEICAFNDIPDCGFVRLDELIRDTKQPNPYAPLPFSAPTLWRMVKANKFPQPVNLSDRVTAWKASEVRKWLEEISNKEYKPKGPKNEN